MISSLTRRTKEDIVSAMKKTKRLKKRRILTVKEFRARFGDDDQCARYLASERWPNGFRCPRCGGRSRGYMASRQVEECAACGYQCSVTAGTIFHKTRVPLTGWFWAIYRMGQDKKGISAVQLSQEIGVSYPTAWLLQPFIDFDEAAQLIALIAVGHGLANCPTRQSGAERRLERIPRAGAARLSAHGHSFTRGSGGGPSTFSLGAHYPVQPEALFARNSP